MSEDNKTILDGPAWPMTTIIVAAMAAAGWAVLSMSNCAARIGEQTAITERAELAKGIIRR